MRLFAEKEQNRKIREISILDANDKLFATNKPLWGVRHYEHLKTLWTQCPIHYDDYYDETKKLGVCAEISAWSKSCGKFNLDFRDKPDSDKIIIFDMLCALKKQWFTDYYARQEIENLVLPDARYAPYHVAASANSANPYRA